MQIEIDFEVFKAITMLRKTETTTYNDVLRELLKLEPASATLSVETQGWTWKGVTLPNGTELRAEYKGAVYFAKIEDGQINLNRSYYGSPSAAAFAITGSGVNGWNFWYVKRANDVSWIQLAKLRPDSGI